jgi:ankyrin repeat protein
LAQGDTPLHNAMRKNQAAAVERLIEKGAAINTRNTVRG